MTHHKIYFAFLGVFLLFSGCARLVGDKTPIEKVYYESQSVGFDEGKVKEIDKTPYIGDQPSFYPIVVPPVVKKVWICPHLTEEGNMVGGYFLYIIVKEPAWYIEDNGQKENIEVIVPYKEKGAIEKQGE
ncbi:MAG TPA: TraV family lipoprotein [Candidatus Ratteibacteria bacterium]|nr:TraV family lipoprotein [Candidatus Ratteibacteria bacterium]